MITAGAHVGSEEPLFARLLIDSLSDGLPTIDPSSAGGPAHDVERLSLRIGVGWRGTGCELRVVRVPAYEGLPFTNRATRDAKPGFEIVEREAVVPLDVGGKVECSPGERPRREPAAPGRVVREQRVQELPGGSLDRSREVALGADPREEPSGVHRRNPHLESSFECPPGRPDGALGSPAHRRQFHDRDRKAGGTPANCHQQAGGGERVDVPPGDAVQRSRAAVEAGRLLLFGTRDAEGPPDASELPQRVAESVFRGRPPVRPPLLRSPPPAPPGAAVRAPAIAVSGPLAPIPRSTYSSVTPPPLRRF